MRRSVPLLVACLLALATGLTLGRLSDLPSSPLPHRARHGSDSPAVVGPAMVGPTGTTNPRVASQRGVGPAAWAPAVSAATILAPTGTALARAGSAVAVRTAEDRSLVPAVAPDVPSSAEQPLCYGEPPSGKVAACPAVARTPCIPAAAVGANNRALADRAGRPPRPRWSRRCWP